MIIWNRCQYTIEKELEELFEKAFNEVKEHFSLAERCLCQLKKLQKNIDIDIDFEILYKQGVVFYIKSRRSKYKLEVPCNKFASIKLSVEEGDDAVFKNLKEVLENE